MIIPFAQGKDSEAGSARKKSPAALRRPDKGDGAKIWRLIGDCPPLDANSMYCNLLQCTDFAESCMLCERDGEIIGWVSGYRLPNDPGVLFIWQVAVHSSARGEGLGKKLLMAALRTEGGVGVTKLRTTITAHNDASWALFRSLAKELGAPLSREPWFECDRDFSGLHDTEHLVSIGPFEARSGKYDQNGRNED